MHNNYHFFKRLIPELNGRIHGLRVLECFSQQKDELILILGRNGDEFIIRADLKSSFTCLSFPGTFSRARKNSVDLFPVLKARNIDEVKFYENERCFSLVSEPFSLLFKMFGNRSNIILFKDEKVIELFKNKMEQDRETNFRSLNRKIDQSHDAFVEMNGDLQTLFPTLGKLPAEYLKVRGYENMDTDRKWEEVQDMLVKMENGPICITELEGEYYLTLLPVGRINEECEGAIEALDLFYFRKIRIMALGSEKKKLLDAITSRLRKGKSYLKKSKNRLNGLKNTSYREMADILMANLHLIPERARSVTLDNFYTNKPIDISLNPKLSPQKNAERYYRKAKNQQKERQILEANIESKADEIEELENLRVLAEETNDLKLIRDWSGPFSRNVPGESRANLPYQKVMFNAYEILIGRNAKANDELTFGVANRNDHWLHARDVAGSHVIIRNPSGQTIPENVLEYAAGLAAWHSKRKNDTLCPVIHVERKYIRKFRGAKPGQVKVEHEKVIMVRPTKS